MSGREAEYTAAAVDFALTKIPHLFEWKFVLPKLTKTTVVPLMVLVKMHNKCLGPKIIRLG